MAKSIKKNITKKNKKKEGTKIKVQKVIKASEFTPSVKKWESIKQIIQDKVEVMGDYFDLATDKSKTKIHDLAMKVSKFVEKDEYGSSPLNLKLENLKTKIKSKTETYSQKIKKPDPLEIQRFEDEGGPAKQINNTQESL